MKKKGMEFIDKRTPQGITYLMRACKTPLPNIVKCLLKASANMELRDSFGQNVVDYIEDTECLDAVIRAMKDEQLDFIYKYNEDGNLALQRAVMISKLRPNGKDMIKLLLKHGVDPRVTNRILDSELVGKSASPEVRMLVIGVDRLDKNQCEFLSVEELRYKLSNEYNFTEFDTLPCKGATKTSLIIKIRQLKYQ
jgi:ankyrin repeat protein